MKPEAIRQGVFEPVFALLQRAAERGYIGEEISQLEHALQAAHFAKKAGCSARVVLAALFHDIGHLCAPHGAAEMDGLGVVDHESIGAKFLLKHGFSRDVARLVAGHVQAKRYLAYKKPDYMRALSAASLGTLKFQGGPMSESEALAFETDPLFKEMVQVRKFDEAAKDPNLEVEGLESYRDLIVAHIATSD